MTTQEYINEHKVRCDEIRKTLPEGEWTTEPDRLNWKYKGLDCMILRSGGSFGLCGYVGLKPNHPLYGKGYSDDGTLELDVHGGLTFSGECGGHICHIPAPGEPEHLHWLGFDCAHFDDVSPAFLEYRIQSHGTYKNLNYVIKEVEHLADQLAEIN